MFDSSLFETPFDDIPRTLSTRTFDQLEDMYIVNLIAGNVSSMSQLLDTGYQPTNDQAVAMTFAASIAQRLLPKIAMKNPITVESLGNLDKLLQNLK